MSLQRETVQTYRKLYRKIREVGCQCGLPNKDGLTAYVSHRFHLVCDAHRQQLMGFISEHNALEKSKKKLRQKELARKFREYEAFLSASVDHVKSITENLPLVPGNAQLTSLLQALGAGIGNAIYQSQIESNFIALAQHEARKEEREELTEHGTGERKNRILQQAILPYAEKLLLAHRSGLRNCMPHPEQPGSSVCPVTETGLSGLTKWQMIEAIVGTRVGVTAHHIKLLGDDEAVIEVDETYNKQTIYVVCQRRSFEHMDACKDEGHRNLSVFTDNFPENSASAQPFDSSGGSGQVFSTDGFSWEEKVERIDIAETEEVRRTVFSSAFLTRAMRLCTAIEAETPLHRSRKTVVVGHGVGGAVALTASLLLLNRGFDLTNVITFGALKSLQGGTLERYLERINPVRVVLEGDPLVDFPVSGAEGHPFVHVGEVLLLSPSNSSSTESVSGTSSARPNPPISSDAVTQASGSLSFHLATARATVQEEVFDDGKKNDSVENKEDEDYSWLLKVRGVYQSRFLVEHYVEHLSNQNVPLSYSENGEEIGMMESIFQ